MTRIPRQHLTGLEALATIVSVGVMIGYTVLSIPLALPYIGMGSGVVIAALDGSLTYLTMALLMPTWGISGLETFRLKRQAEQYAGWNADHHLLKEQRIECAIRKAWMAQARGNFVEAKTYAEKVMAMAEGEIGRSVGSIYYALCLGVCGYAFQAEGRYQEALEEFARATRMNLQPPSLSAPYYAQAAGALYLLGRFEDAVLFAQQAIAGAVPDASAAEAHRWAALSLAELRRGAEAVTHCEAGMFIQPITPVNIWLMADRPWLLFLAGREQEAEAKFAELEPMAKTGPLSDLMQQEYQETLGRVRLLQGSLEASKALFSASLNGPLGQNISALYHLSLLAQNEGDIEAAQAYRQRLMRESPESFYAQRLREEIPSLSNMV